MSMRPVDLQTIIPKLPEVQKIKNAENDLEKNNLNINIQKEQRQNEQNTRQIIEAKKAQEARVNKDGKQNRRQGDKKGRQKEGQSEGNDVREENKKMNPIARIDIRI